MTQESNDLRGTRTGWAGFDDPEAEAYRQAYYKSLEEIKALREQLSDAAPADRLADVRLGAEAMLAACKATTPYEQDTDRWPDPARIAETVGLPARLTAQPDGVDWRKLAEDAWNGWRIGKDIVTPMHALRDALAAAPAREDGVRAAFQCPACGAAIKAPADAKGALERYGWHDLSCPDYPTRTKPLGLCDCGFTKALAAPAPATRTQDDK